MVMSNTSLAGAVGGISLAYIEPQRRSHPAVCPYLPNMGISITHMVASGRTLLYASVAPCLSTAQTFLIW